MLGVWASIVRLIAQHLDRFTSMALPFVAGAVVVFLAVGLTR